MAGVKLKQSPPAHPVPVVIRHPKGWSCVVAKLETERKTWLRLSYSSSEWRFRGSRGMKNIPPSGNENRDIKMVIWPHDQGEPIGQKIFGVRVVVREVLLIVLFVWFGKAIFHRDYGVIWCRFFLVFRPCVSQYHENLDTTPVEVLPLSHQQGEDVHCTCFVLRAVQGCCKNACQNTRTMNWAIWKPYDT